MNTFTLLNRCRVVITKAYHPLIKTFVKSHTSINKFKPSTNVVVNTRNMSQTNITSFFKKTPKKACAEENNTAESVSSTNETNESVECNGNAKRSKRLRSNSKENNSPKSNSASPVGSEKKKKAKRQRIESSESESESPNKSTSDENEIKLDKSTVAKTYDSPKSKKSKESKDNKAVGKKIKEEKISPKSKTTPKKDIKQSPLGKFAVKIEKKDDSKTSKEETIENGDAKVESDVKSGKEDKVAPVAEVDYNPGKSNYDPVKDACWVKDQPVPYLALAKTLEVIEATSARLKMIDILSNYFRSVMALTPEDLLPSIYLCLNQLGPAYESLELGIAETYLMKAIGQCTGRSLAQTRAAAARAGDLGAVAEAARATQRTMFAAPALRVRAVLAALRDIAALAGHASVNRKIQKIQALYVACRHSEARYLIRSLEGKLRIGLAEQSVLQALGAAAAAADVSSGAVTAADADAFKALAEEYTLLVKTTYCACPNYGALVPALQQHGARALPQHCRLTPGVPLKPMLAHPARGVAEVLARFENENFTCEFKYDGERAQIHVPALKSAGAEGEGEVETGPDLARAAIFSRNQENNTSKYPDVLERLPALLGPEVTSCVLDCEAVAFDVASQRILPFQVLATRKRKDAAAQQVTVQVCVFVFDLLYLNGASLVREPLRARRALLRAHLREAPGRWRLAQGGDCASPDEVEALLHEAVAASCEGLMVKALDGDAARYDIARRSRNWLKLKKDYLEGVGDTIDAVVIGAYNGKGKRAGKFGGFLLACRDPDNDTYQALCKLGTGFSDEQLERLTRELEALRLPAPRPYYEVDAALAPDAWLAAAAVWELRCADLSLSPLHRAALGLAAPGRGVSLRFPRLLRERPDKAPEQATTARQIADMYLAQDCVRNAQAQPPPLDDFY